MKRTFYRYTNTKSVNLINNQKSVKNIVKVLFENSREWKFLIEIYISRVTAGTIAPITSSGVLIFDWLRNNWHFHKHRWWSFIFLRRYDSRMCQVLVSFSACIVIFTSVEAYTGAQSSCRRVSSGKYRYFSENERLKLREKAKQMFYFGYDSYMNFAFPKDELDPIHCTGRGPDYDTP